MNGQELWLQVTPEWPEINPEYLKRLARTAEERWQILDALGLLDATDDPPDNFIVEVLNRMEAMVVYDSVYGTAQNFPRNCLQQMLREASNGKEYITALHSF